MSSSHNDLVLARMRVGEFLLGDEAALEKLSRLPFEAAMCALLESLEAVAADERRDPMHTEL